VLLTDAELIEEEDMSVMVPQERALLRVLIVWTVVIVYVGWISNYNPSPIVGFIVNLNLVVLYGAPLQTMHTVISTKNSASIHTLTMIMNWLNTSFWISYGIARHDAVIIVPNFLGLLLGLIQGVLKFLYPSDIITDRVMNMQPIPNHDELHGSDLVRPSADDIDATNPNYR
jgi:uncharacterized protein with PQ loop repeat